MVLTRLDLLDLARGEHIDSHLREWERLKENGGTDGTLRQDRSAEIGRLLETALWPVMGY